MAQGPRAPEAVCSAWDRHFGICNQRFRWIYDERSTDCGKLEKLFVPNIIFLSCHYWIGMDAYEVTTQQISRPLQRREVFLTPSCQLVPCAPFQFRLGLRIGEVVGLLLSLVSSSCLLELPSKRHLSHSECSSLLVSWYVSSPPKAHTVYILTVSHRLDSVFLLLTARLLSWSPSLPTCSIALVLHLFTIPLGILVRWVQKKKKPE